MTNMPSFIRSHATGTTSAAQLLDSSYGKTGFFRCRTGHNRVGCNRYDKVDCRHLVFRVSHSRERYQSANSVDPKLFCPLSELVSKAIGGPFLPCTCAVEGETTLMRSIQVIEIKVRKKENIAKRTRRETEASIASLRALNLSWSTANKTNQVEKTRG